MAAEAPSPHGDDATQQLKAYLRANREAYTREALTSYLTERGFTTEQIAAAWQATVAEGSEATVATASDGAGQSTRQTVLQLLAVLLALATGAIGLFSLLAMSHNSLPIWIYIVLFPIEIALVTRWLVRSIGRSASLRAGDTVSTVGWLLAAPLAMVGLMGVCYAYGASFGCLMGC
jgi:hypothetical protein